MIIRLIVLVLAQVFVAFGEQAAAPASLPKITGKDVAVHPYTSNVPNRKIDPKTKGVFETLKVVVTSGRQTSIRLTGKKETENENLEGQHLFHTGKVFLVPAAERSGTLKISAPTVPDVLRYLLVLELPDNELKAQESKFEKGEYQWEVTKKDGRPVYQFSRGGTVVHTISGPVDEVKSFGLAACVRWVGGEADATMTIK